MFNIIHTFSTPSMQGAGVNPETVVYNRQGTIVKRIPAGFAIGGVSVGQWLEWAGFGDAPAALGVDPESDLDAGFGNTTSTSRSGHGSGQGESTEGNVRRTALDRKHIMPWHRDGAPNESPSYRYTGAVVLLRMRYTNRRSLEWPGNKPLCEITLEVIP